MANIFDDVSVQMLLVWLSLCCVPVLLIYIVHLHYSRREIERKSNERIMKMRDENNKELLAAKDQMIELLKAGRMDRHEYIHRHAASGQLLLDEASTSWTRDTVFNGDMVHDLKSITTIQRRQKIIEENAVRVKVTAENFGLLMHRMFDLAPRLGFHINRLMDWLKSRGIISIDMARRLSHEHLHPTERVNAVIDFFIESSKDPQETYDILREFFCHEDIGFAHLWDHYLGTVDSNTIPVHRVHVTRTSWKYTVHTLILHNCPNLEELIQYIPEMKKIKKLDISRSNPFERCYFNNPVQTLQKVAHGLPQLEWLDISGTNLAEDETEHDRADTNLLINDSDIAGLRALHQPLKYLAIIDATTYTRLFHRLPCAHQILSLDTADRIQFAFKLFKGNTDRVRQLLAYLLLNYWFWSRSYTVEDHMALLHDVLKCMNEHSEDEMVMEFGLGIVNVICQLVDMQNRIPYIKKNIDHGLTTFGAANAIIRLHCTALLARFHYTSKLGAGCEFRAVLVGLVTMESEQLRRMIRALHSIVRAKERGHEMFIENAGIKSSHCTILDQHLQCMYPNLQCVLSLIQQRIKLEQFDVDMGNAWSLLQNALDTSDVILEEKATRQFVDSDGLQHAMKCAQLVSESNSSYKDHIMECALGTICNLRNNQIRTFFMSYQENIPIIIGALDVDNGMRISRASAEILIELLLVGPSEWTCVSPDYNTIDQRVCSAVEQWNVNTFLGISYSFLDWVWSWINNPQCCSAGHFALWMMANLTILEGQVYCSMLYNDGAVEKLQALIDEEVTDPFRREMAQITINNIKQWLRRQTA